MVDVTMYRIPANLDLSPVVGEFTTQVRVGQFDLQFTFGPVNFAVASAVNLFRDGKLMAHWEEGQWPDPGFYDIMNTKVQQTMTLKETLKQLKALGNAKVRAQNAKSGAGDNQFGVSLGDIRVLAKKIRMDHELALSLWETGNIDAQFLATLLVQPKKLSAKEMDRMVRSVSFVRVADWLIAYVVRQHPDKEALRKEWMAADDRWAARAGWDLTAERVAKSPDGLDLPALLDRIESEMAEADPEVQWTMNNTLATIGIHFPKHRKRAIAIGEKLGVYRDYPVSKGCTSPFAPIWINAMVSRQG